MHPHAALIQQFYQAFQQHDAEAMVACYHPAITFSDPVFHDLQGERAKAMWLMLVGRSKDMVLTFRDISADDHSGKAYWEATYTFSQTGRKVLNKVHSTFLFQEGKIRTQHDTFDLWRWASMALGPRGSLLGWTPLVQNAIHQQAIKGLDAFIAKQQG
jgi:ketosteroid isomerase-like protein